MGVTEAQLESPFVFYFAALGLSTEVGVQGLGPQPGGEAAVGHRLRVETTLPVGLSAVGECSPRHGSVLSP